MEISTQTKCFTFVHILLRFFTQLGTGKRFVGVSFDFPSWICVLFRQHLCVDPFFFFFFITLVIPIDWWYTYSYVLRHKNRFTIYKYKNNYIIILARMFMELRNFSFNWIKCSPRYKFDINIFHWMNGYTFFYFTYFMVL